MPGVSPATGNFDVSGGTTTPKMDDHLIIGGATTPKSLFFGKGQIAGTLKA